MTVKRFRFSLIELLAVIALVSLLTALMLPAFRKMTAGNAVDQMASQIKLALEQAQSHAAVSRRLTAVIFYTEYNPKEPNLSLGGYSIVELKKTTDDEYEFSNFISDSKWSNRVDGAIISKIDFNQPTTNGEGILENLPTNANNGIVGINNLIKTSSENNEYKTTENAIIFRPTGGAVAEGSSYSLYIVISEAILMGQEIKNPGYEAGKTANFKILKLNLLTGRCEFLR